MAQRSVASGVISFGLVSISVKFYLAAQAKSIGFKMLTKKGNPIKQQYVDAFTNEPTSYPELGKGYEYEKGKFIAFTKEELQLLGDTSNNGSLEIVEFVPGDTIDLISVEKTYHLGAEKGSDKAYRLLAAAMDASGMCGVAQWVSRGRQHLVVIAPRDGGLVAFQMFYADEIREFDNGTATFPLEEKELALADKLIQAMASDAFDPSKYKDEYRARLDKAIEEKVANGAVSTPVDGSGGKASASDLFEALKASIAKGHPVEVHEPGDDQAKKKPSKKRRGKAA